MLAAGLSYREAVTADGPVVLFLHGYPQSSFMWDRRDAGRCGRRLARRGARLRGLRGLRAGPARHLGAAHGARSSASARELGIETCVPVVHDWGGLIGIRWACEHPDAVRALVISSTGFFPTASGTAWRRRSASPARAKRLIDGIDRDGLRGADARSTPGSPTRRSTSTGSDTRTTPGAAAQLEMYRSGDFAKLEGYDLAALGVPTLLLWGEEDEFAPVAGAHRFAATSCRTRSWWSWRALRTSCGRTRPRAAPPRSRRSAARIPDVERLFEPEERRRRDPSPSGGQPLAARMRPASLGEFVGQEHLLGRGSALRTALEEGRPHSMILYGPPGTGKTTLARLLAVNARAAFEEASAVNAGRAEVREVIERGRHRRGTSGERTIFFLDEIHRFNKAQQDTLLPAVEDGARDPGGRHHGEPLLRGELGAALALPDLRAARARGRARACAAAAGARRRARHPGRAAGGRRRARLPRRALGRRRAHRPLRARAGCETVGRGSAKP